MSGEDRPRECAYCTEEYRTPPVVFRLSCNSGHTAGAGRIEFCSARCREMAINLSRNSSCDEAEPYDQRADLRKPEDHDDDGDDWERGYRAAGVAQLQAALSVLGYMGTKADHAKWIVERETAVRALRQVCKDYGDNDWPDNLSLADVVEKHLHRNLGEK